MPPQHDPDRRAAVEQRYHFDLAGHAAAAIAVAQAGEAARKPSVNEAAPVPVKATITPNRFGAIAVDTNGIKANPVIRLRGK